MKLFNWVYRLFKFKQGGVIPRESKSMVLVRLSEPEELIINKAKLLEEFKGIDDEMEMSIRASEIYGNIFAQSIVWMLKRIREQKR